MYVLFTEEEYFNEEKSYCALMAAAMLTIFGGMAG